jgi:FkbM family methyltransferase
MRFVDVGANVGYFTLLASRAVGPEGMVFAVEPSPYAADRLARTITDNRVGNVRLEKIGLGRESGECTLYDPLPDNHTPTMLGDIGSSGRCVPVRRLDDCLADWGVDRVDLLKIDVEGYEPLVFEGASAALSAGRIWAILCEFNEYWLRRAGSSVSGLREQLLGFGFEDITDSAWDVNRPTFNRLFVLPAGRPPL